MLCKEDSWINIYEPVIIGVEEYITDRRAIWYTVQYDQITERKENTLILEMDGNNGWSRLSR